MQAERRLREICDVIRAPRSIPSPGRTNRGQEKNQKGDQNREGRSITNSSEGGEAGECHSRHFMF